MKESGGTTEVVADGQIAQSTFDKFCRGNTCRGFFRKQECQPTCPCSTHLVEELSMALAVEGLGFKTRGV